MRNYINEDKYHQYLVDGAVLKCTAATTDDFTYAEGETVVLENKDDEVCNITLDVHENPMNINGLTYATIKDTIQNVNIVAPKCNCCLAADRDAERNSIFEVDGTTYLTKTNIAQSPFTAGVGKILDVVIEESEGITMTSVLFCKHGGLIMPVTSGQEDSANTLEFICNFLNKNTKSYSENMSGFQGSDANLGKAYTITEGASISEIDLLIAKEIEWEGYFEYKN